MLTIPHWNILVVDDEPDVHAATDLALKHQSFFGVKCKMHHALSGREARELVSQNEELRTIVAACLIDVIMESDTAGLDLCQYIRTIHANTQLILRTGEPGMAPARKVVDEYDISAYLAKADATAEGLYITLKPRLQAVFTMREHMCSALAWNAVQLESRRDKDVADCYFRVINKYAKYMQFNAAWDFGNRYFGFDHFADQQTYEAIKPRLIEAAVAQLESGTSLDGQANRYAQVDDYVLVETRVPGHSETARLILKNPTCPPGQLGGYAMGWRRDLMDLARAVWSG